jgi:3,4-dihydroxy 2-butanone 4-phosphate synthase/GTP cyclohydrolase II
MKDASFEQILDDLKEGNMILLQDARSRENEGDLVMAAEQVTPDAINFMATYGRGLICVPLLPDRARELGLHPMTSRNTAELGTAFTVSVDARDGISTGISAKDRAQTIQVLIDEKSKPEDLVRPGHVFPLVAKEQGVFQRRGQTEGSIDLMRLAGLKPAAVICEVMNEDGTMAKDEQLSAFCDKHDIRSCRINDILRYRSRHEQVVEEEAETELPTQIDRFALSLFSSDLDEHDHLVLAPEDQSDEPEEPPIVRIHSQCLTGDVFGSQRCDCREQLESSLHLISQSSHGLLIYSTQEGRGIGLADKLRAYEKKDEGLDTVEANESLGLPGDQRQYWSAANILHELGYDRVRLLTNNPQKVEDLEEMGIEVTERVPLEVDSEGEKREYLRTKKEKLGHLLQEI